MSVHYLLDGYNIINQMPELSLKKLEDRRNDLIALIEVYRPEGSSNNTITVIFDGKSGMWGSESSSKVKVFFTVDETADEKIKRLVDQSRNKKQMVVVTNDRSIKYAVRSAGAAVISVEDFLAKLKPHKPKTSRSASKAARETTKVISKTAEYKINSELENLWLNKKKKA